MELKGQVVVGGLALAIALLTLFGDYFFGLSLTRAFILLGLTTFISIVVRLRSETNFARIVLTLILVIGFVTPVIVSVALTYLFGETVAMNDAGAYLGVVSVSVLSFSMINIVWVAILSFPAKIASAIRRSI